MSICQGITQRGMPCTKRIRNNTYCHLHTPLGININEYIYPPVLPKELWDVIISQCNLQTLGNIHLVSRYFYQNVRNMLISTPYYTILIDNNGNNVSGNCHLNLYKFYIRHQTNHTISEYIINNTIFPYNIEANKILPHTIIFPLLMLIRNYKDFCTTLNNMKSNNWKEDNLFSFSRDLEHSVIRYATTKKVNYLINEIITRFPSTNDKPIRILTHKIRLSNTVHIIDWRKCSFIIHEVSDFIKKMYPEFTLFLPYGRLYYCFFGITSY